MRRAQGPFHPAFAVILPFAMATILSAYLSAAEEVARLARDATGVGAEDPATQILAAELKNRIVAARLATEDMVRLAEGYDFKPTVHWLGTFSCARLLPRMR